MFPWIAEVSLYCSPNVLRDPRSDPALRSRPGCLSCPRWHEPRGQDCDSDNRWAASDRLRDCIQSDIALGPRYPFVGSHTPETSAHRQMDIALDGVRDYFFYVRTSTKCITVEPVTAETVGDTETILGLCIAASHDAALAITCWRPRIHCLALAERRFRPAGFGRTSNRGDLDRRRALA